MNATIVAQVGLAMGVISGFVSFIKPLIESIPGFSAAPKDTTRHNTLLVVLTYALNIAAVVLVESRAPGGLNLSVNWLEYVLLAGGSGSASVGLYKANTAKLTIASVVGIKPKLPSAPGPLSRGVAAPSMAPVPALHGVSDTLQASATVKPVPVVKEPPAGSSGKGTI